MVWIAPLLESPLGGRHVAQLSRRRLAIRVALVDACLSGVIVGRLHASWFGVADVPEGESPTFVAAFVVAAVVCGGLALHALLRSVWRPGPVLGRTVLAALASFPVWGVLLAVVAAPFWDPIDPTVRVVSIGGPRGSSLTSIPFLLLMATPASIVLTVPLGLVFGAMHAGLVWLLDAGTVARSLQPLARARSIGLGLGLLAAVAILAERALVPTSHPWWWSIAPASLLLVGAAVDGAMLLRAERAARRLLREALDGAPARLRVVEGDVPLFDREVVPLAPVPSRPVVLVEGTGEGGHRGPGARRAMALVPRELCQVMSTPTGSGRGQGEITRPRTRAPR